MSDEQQSEQPTQPEQREWIPVPPPHPYAAAVPAGTGRATGGKGLAIAAMSIGLIALFTVLVSAFYYNAFIAMGGFAGVVAVALGIVALVKRSRPKGAAIAGLAAGAVAILAAIVLTAFVTVAFTTNLLGGGAPAEQSGGSDEPWTPGAEQQQLLEWPSNMATGGIVFAAADGGSSTPVPVPLPSDPPAPATPPADRQPDRLGGNDVLVFVDYSCPHCALFEQRNGEFLRGLAASGAATVEIVPLSFLDRASAGSYYSSRAAGAMACLADAQPEAAWLGNAALLDPAVQPNGGSGLTNEDIVRLLDDAAGGLNDGARGCIEAERFVPFVQSLNQWAFANPVSGALDSESRLQGTPTIFVNGVYFDGDPEDPAAFAAFYEEQAN